MQSAILRVRLKFLTVENEHRRSLARQYHAGLQDTSLTLPVERAEARHVYHQYIVRSPARDALRDHLRGQGIGTLVHYPVPVHLQPAYAGRLPVAPGGLPCTEAAAKQVLSLPMYPQLTEAQTRWVADQVAACAPRL